MTNFRLNWLKNMSFDAHLSTQLIKGSLPDYHKGEVQ